MTTLTALSILMKNFLWMLYWVFVLAWVVIVTVVVIGVLLVVYWWAGKRQRNQRDEQLLGEGPRAGEHGGGEGV